MEVRRLSIALSTSTGFQHCARELSGFKNRIPLLDNVEEHITFVPINLGLVNIIYDNVSNLNSLDCLKPSLGSNIATKIVEAYKSQQLGTNKCKILGLSRTERTPSILHRNIPGVKPKRKHNSPGDLHRDVLPELIRRMLHKGDEHIDVGEISAFQFAAYAIFCSVYAERFQYACPRYTSQMAMFSNITSHGKNSLFWEYKDDESHSMMSMIHVINMSVTSILNAIHINLVLGDMDENQDTSEVRSIIKDKFLELSDQRLTPSMYAMLAYLWLTAASDVEAGASGAMLLFEDDFEALIEVLPELAHPSIAKDSVRKLDNKDVCHCTVEDGYASHTTIMYTSDMINEVISMNLGIMKTKITFPNVNVAIFEKNVIKTGKQMTIIDANSTTLFKTIEVNERDFFLLRRSRSDVLMWLRLAGLFSTAKSSTKFTDQELNALKMLSDDVFPWVNEISGNGSTADFYVQMLKAMCTLEASHNQFNRIIVLIDMAVPYLYNFNYEAKSNLLFAIART
ncbi:non-structural protein [Scaphoideus titanus reo-like virus 1]|nr:non-structural protein [Scaphoideus titanus reo-like virus 1]